MLGFCRATHFALQIAGLTMLCNDSVQIAATSRASAHARALTATRQSVASETPRGVSASGHGRMPVAWRRGSGLPPHGKFSALQSLENSQNAEGISILREPAARAAERAAWISKARRMVRVAQRSGPARSDSSGSRGSSAGWIAIANPLPRRDGEGNFPPCIALKTHKMRKESRFLSEKPVLSFPRSSRSLDTPDKPRRKVWAAWRRPRSAITRLPADLLFCPAATARPDVQRSSAIREARRAGWFAKRRLARVTSVY
jgi:hypothetical protein